MSKTAFVLAGGGTKGAFEAGAIRYLVEEEAITPEVITATSAGSICAAVLAQARTHQELVARARELHDDLLAMTHSDLLFGKQPWLGALDGTPLGRAVNRLVIDRSRPPLPGEPVAPDETAVAAADRAARRRRRVQVVAHMGRSLPHLLRARKSLRGNAGSLLTLEPLAKALRDGGPTGIRPVDPALIGRQGLELRVAVAALGDGVLRYVTQDGQIVASDAVTPVAGPVDVLEGVLASASVPLLFPPRPLAGDVYVDGGVANNIPVDAAVRLGATQVFAILAVPLVQPRDNRDYTAAAAPAVFMRATAGIAFTERQLANLNPPLPGGTTVTVIDPVTDVVGPFEVSQGLMLLDMDYGWMRAADVLAEVTDDVRRQAAADTEAVVIGRTQAWHREETLWASGRPSAGDLRALAAIKARVQEAVTDRKGLGLPTPPDAERWWSGYEVHTGPTPPGLPADPSTS